MEVDSCSSVMINWLANMNVTRISRQMENNTMWVPNTNLQSQSTEIMSQAQLHEPVIKKYEVKLSNNDTLEMKSDANALTLSASSEPHIRTRVQTACTISWSPFQYLSVTRSSEFFPLWQVSPMSNFLCSAWRLQEYTKFIKDLTSHVRPQVFN